MTAKHFIQKAQQIQAGSSNQSPLALEEYKKAIAAYKKGDDEYELLYANYQVMWIYSNTDNNQAVPYAEKCLELLQPAINAGAIMHFTEMGQFQQEVMRYATNTIGWDVFTKTDDKAELEKALTLVSLGSANADAPEYFYIQDTKVRILLKLARNDEAYRIVRSCLLKERSFAGFNDITKSKDYQQWQSNFETGIVLTLDDEEKIFLEKAASITEKIRLQLTDLSVNKNNIEEAIPNKEIITLGEARQLYGINYYHDKDELVLIIKGDVYINGNLNDAWFNKQLEGMSWNNTLYGMIITGNLTISGDVIDDNSLELFVAGNLICDQLLSYDGMIQIKGDANIQYGIYGEYNDGSLDVHGTLTTPYIIAYDHSMPKESAGEFIHLEISGNDRDNVAIGSWSSGWYYEDAQKLLSPAVWDENDEFSVDLFFSIVKNGQNAFIQAK